MTSSRARSYLPNGGKVVAMRKVEALIHPYKLEDVKAELKNVDFEDFAISEVFLTGPRHTIKTRYRGCEYEADVPRLKVEILLFTNNVDDVVDALARAACTGTGSSILPTACDRTPAGEGSVLPGDPAPPEYCRQ